MLLAFSLDLVTFFSVVVDDVAVFFGYSGYVSVAVVEVVVISIVNFAGQSLVTPDVRLRYLRLIRR